MTQQQNNQQDIADQSELPIEKQLLMQLMAFRAARALQTVLTLGLADLLADGPRSIQDLADATGTHAPSLQRVLRAVTAQGFFKEIAPGVIAQNELSAYFRKDHPSNMYYMAALFDNELEFMATKSLDYSVRTGKPALDMLYHMSSWEYYTSHPEIGKIFHHAMTAYSFFDNRAVISAYDFSTISTLADIAGGIGSFLLSLLKRYPHLRGILFDQPDVIAEARSAIEQSEYAARCTLSAGDMFDTLPTGADIYFLKHILHNWSDDDCLKILNNCRRAMNRQSKLLIAEIVIPVTGASLLDTLSDIGMMTKLAEGARQRTTDEFNKMLNDAGFKHVTFIPTEGRIMLIEAIIE